MVFTDNNTEDFFEPLQMVNRVAFYFGEFVCFWWWYEKNVLVMEFMLDQLAEPLQKSHLELIIRRSISFIITFFINSHPRLWALEMTLAYSTAKCDAIEMIIPFPL